MSYFLKKSTPTGKGLYLQIYESMYIPGKGKRNRSYKAIGYVSDLIEKGITDPVAFYQREVDVLNEKLAQQKALQIGERSLSSNVGYFLSKALFDYLDMDDDLNYVASHFRTHYRFSEIMRALCYARIVCPGSKFKAFEKVIPELYGSPKFSYDQILDAVNFIGSDYHKYIEVLNHHIEKRWKRTTDKVYFDCTNYYFEINSETDLQRKGPSKEQRRSPIIGQALMLDAEQIPIDTEFYPGNESEKPYLRKRIEAMRERNHVTGRVVQVADKGLNCAANIHAAVIEADDGYIFSKSLKGTSLTKREKEKILSGQNDWKAVYDANGTMLYRYMILNSVDSSGELHDYDVVSYRFKANPGDKRDTSFTVKEKRIIIYSQKLAAKQKAEIRKQVTKLRNRISYRDVVRDSLGHAAKYVNMSAIDRDGRKVKIAASLNEDKVNEDMNLAGYNMLVTSEIDADPGEIVGVYHHLWRIEESFKIMKSYLEARPVFVSNTDTILGHFLICYYALTIMRLLELKVFKDEISTSMLFTFIRQYNITKCQDGSFINCSTNSNTYLKIKEVLGLEKLGNVYLTAQNVQSILNTDLSRRI